jgi:Ca2+-binding RTX toxin-like protein
MIINFLHGFLNRQSKKAQRKQRRAEAKAKKNSRARLSLHMEQLEDRTVPSGFANFGPQLQSQILALQASLNNALAVGSLVPVVGDRLKNEPLLRVFNDSKLATIATNLSKLDPSGGDAAYRDAVTNSLFAILGPSGTGLIPNISGLQVTPHVNSSTIDVQMNFNKTLPGFTVGGNFGLGLAGLPFNVTASGGVKVQSQISETALFHFDGNNNNSTISGPITVSATATLLPGSNIKATVGFLQADLMDNGSNVQVTFTGGPAVAPQVKFNAHVNFQADATFGGDTQFPSLGANFLLDWNTLGNVNATPQRVQFNNVSVNLGQFLTNLLRPVVEKIQIVTGPLQPFIDFLKKPVPGLSDLSEAAGLGQLTIKDLIKASSQSSAEMNKQIEMYLKIAGIIDTINNFPKNLNAKIVIGNLDLTGNANKLINGGTLVVGGTTINWETALDKLGLGQVAIDIKKLVNDAQNTVNIRFPLIQDPLNSAFDLFIGKHADLVTLDLKYKMSSPPPAASGSIFGVAYGFNGGLSIDSELQLGYDTYGIEKFVTSGKPTDLANGFYLGDKTHFTLSGGIGIYAGAGIVVLSASIDGGLKLTEPVTAKLNMFAAGNPDKDPTKLHYNEIQFDPSCLFTARGKLDASVSISVTIGVKVSTLVGDVTLGYTHEFNIASVTLFDFSTPEKQCLGLGSGTGNGLRLAENNNGTLTLAMGPNVGLLRNVVPSADGNEDFFVKVDGDTLWVLAYGTAQGFPRSQVSTIVADGGFGDDVIVVDSSVGNINASLEGGTGKDRLEFYGNGDDVEMSGGPGNDFLIGGDGNEKMDGGPDNDLLIGGAGNDQLLGNTGNDKLFAGLGNDFVDGGDGDDEIDMGGGHDAGFGGNGADTFTIYPGIGSPVLVGGGLFAADISPNDVLIVKGSNAADHFELTKIDAQSTRISRGDANVAGPGFPDNPVAVGIEQIFIESGNGPDEVTINDLSGTVIQNVVVNQSEASRRDNAADTVVVNGRASSDFANVKQLYVKTSEAVILPQSTTPARFSTTQRVTGIGPEIWTPNAFGDRLIVNTLGGNDYITVTSDPHPAALVPKTGTVEIDAGNDNDFVHIDSISSATIVSGGAGNDTMIVSTFAHNLNDIAESLTVLGGTGLDELIVNDHDFNEYSAVYEITANTIQRGKSLRRQLPPLFATGLITYGGFASDVVVNGSAMGNSYLLTGSPTSLLALNTGFGADTVNVLATNGELAVNGQNGLDTVNIGSNLGTRQIGGQLTVTNNQSYSAVTVDDSADTVARTAILYAAPLQRFPLTVLSGLTPGGDILLRSDNLKSLNILAGSGGNTFRIHNTPSSFISGGLSTTVSTGNGSDQVTVDGTTGALALNVQEGNNITNFGSDNASLDRIQGEIHLVSPRGSNAVLVDDRLTTADRSLTHTISATSYTRTGAAPIFLSGVSNFTLSAGSAADTINLQGRPVPQGGFSFLYLFAGPGNDVINIGTPANQLAGLGIVSVKGEDGTDELNIYDQGTTSSRNYALKLVLGNIPSFSTPDASLLYYDFENLFLSGGSGGNTFAISSIKLNASPGGSLATVHTGTGDDVVTVGTSLDGIKSPLSIDGQDGNDRLILNDSAAKTGQAYVVLPRAVNRSNAAPVLFDAVEHLDVTGTAFDDSFQIGDATHSLDGLQPNVTLNGKGGVNTLDYSAYPVAGSQSIPGLVSWYKGEGNAEDAIGLNSGTLVNGVAFAPGKVGQAFSFDGVDDYVDLGNPASLDIPGSLTVEAWVSYETLSQYKYLVADFDVGGGVSQGSLGILQDGRAFWYQSMTDGSAIQVESATSLVAGQWYHVGVVRDDVAKTITLFVNGVEDGGSSYAGTVVGLQQKKLLGGATPVGFAGDFFNGQIDEPTFYNRALTAVEIQQLANSGNGAAVSGIEVNLPLHTASGLLGGIRNIQNVIGSAGNDILVGNGGNVLDGGLGRDLLIAGAWASALIGGGDQDILVGGTTNYDRDPAALRAILAEWTSASDYATRVANLKNGTNSAPMLNASTVHSNHRANTLNGNAGLDFFFANLARDSLDMDPFTEQLVAL